MLVAKPIGSNGRHIVKILPKLYNTYCKNVVLRYIVTRYIVTPLLLIVPLGWENGKQKASDGEMYGFIY